MRMRLTGVMLSGIKLLKVIDMDKSEIKTVIAMILVVCFVYGMVYINLHI